MEALNQSLKAFVALRDREWTMPSRRTVFWLLILCAVFMRLPYFFLSNEARLWRYELSYHDEALFIMQGREILDGYLPYIRHWDNRPPFGWMVFALIYAITGGNLMLYRIFGALYIGVTSYVLYRTLADRGRPGAGILSGVYYSVFASVIQAGQSFIYEHVAGLPFALLIYLLLNPKPGRRYAVKVALLATATAMILTNFLLIFPAVVLLFPTCWRTTFESMPAGVRLAPTFKNRFRVAMDWLLPKAMYAFLVFGVFIGGYAIIYFMYWLEGYHDFLVRSLIDAPFTISRQPLDERMFTQMSDRWFSFVRKVLRQYVYSLHWLLPMLVGLFLGRAVATCFEKPGTRDTVLCKLLVILVFSAFTMFFRNGNFYVFPYYMMQPLAIVCLAMGSATAFRLRDTRWFIMMLVAMGLFDATRMALSYYPPLIAHATAEDKSSHFSFLNDRIYRIADEINKYPVQGQALIVCTEDDMIYVLTKTQNPRFFIFPSFARYHFLAWVLGVPIKSTYQIMRESNPAGMVGWKSDSCFTQGGEFFYNNYHKVATVDNNEIYIRNDLKPIVSLVGPVPPAP